MKKIMKMIKMIEEITREDLKEEIEYEEEFQKEAWKAQKISLGWKRKKLGLFLLICYYVYMIFTVTVVIKKSEEKDESKSEIVYNIFI